MSKEIESLQATDASRTASHLVEVDPYLVAFSQNNPRKRRGLDIDSLNALASSIKAQGLAQPILVRPLPGDRAQDTFTAREEGRPLPTYELVCGERRLRASRLAELDAIPMLVRDLSDEQALELQLVENIEREDLDPMEEAEGFELLRTKLGYTIEQIAERIGRGKGTSYVYKTMKLLALTPECREAMYEGHLGRSTGLLVARYPASQQADVVRFIKSLATAGEPAPYRSVAPQVFTRFNLDLAKAVWAIEDANLVPDAGACTTCPKRSGAHGDLFGDAENSPDSCTDPDCFASKREAHVAQVKAKAQKDGIKVIEGDEARAAFFSPHSPYMNGYTRVDSVAYTEKTDDGKERQVTFGDALRSMGKKAPKPRIIINPFNGDAVTVITDDLADKLQENAPDREEAGGSTSKRAPVVDERPDDVRALDNYDVRRAVMIRLFQAVRDRDRTDGEVLLMAKALFALQEWEVPLVTAFLNWDGDLEGVDYLEMEGVICGKLDALPAADVAAIATMLAIELASHSIGDNNAMALQLAKVYGIDVLAVRDKVAEDLEPRHPGDEDDQAERAEQEDHPASDDAVAATGNTDEPAAAIGARVRIKDDLRGPGGKFRKISGREGVLLTALDDDNWMFRGDGTKEKARVTREEFVVLAPADSDSDAVETRNWPLPAKTTLDPVAAWPFPTAPKGGA